MTSVLWVYADPDPLASGELRRIGVPALAMDEAVWSCTVTSAGACIGERPLADVAVVALAAADAVALLAATTRVVIEIDTATALGHPHATAILRGLSNRIAGVVARGIRAAAWAGQVLNGAAPVWLIPDPAVRRVELAAAAMGLGLPPRAEAELELGNGLDLWFCEPGDHIGADEVEALAAAWGGEDPSRLIVAPPLVRAWMGQARVSARTIPWSPATLQQALSKAERCRFFGTENYVQARRRVLALRSGAPAIAPVSPSPAVFEPARVTASWEEALSTVLAAPTRVARDRERLRVLAFLDLIQDLDPILPVLDELHARPEIELQVAATSWVTRHSPRTVTEIRARRLPLQLVDRSAVVGGIAPEIRAIDAVVVVADSSLRAHACSHALVNRARAERIPTFAFQHGVENVGLHHVSGEDDAAVAADHMFVWFPPNRTPPSASPALRPRLVHVGRSPARASDMADVNAAFAAFDSIVAVFENLHWSRYDQTWRVAFLTDCAEFAAADPTRAVILKPHHAGLWTVKNRHLIPQWPSNLIVTDPTDAFWEPYTAGALVQLADRVITTPSTVALDAVQADKPVAVAAYGLELPAFAPLPMIQRLKDWTDFCASAGSTDDARRRAIFLNRTAQGDHAAADAADYIQAAAAERRALRRGAVTSDEAIS